MVRLDDLEREEPLFDSTGKYVELGAGLGDVLADKMSDTEEELRYKGYAKLLHQLSWTIKTTKGNVSTVLEELKKFFEEKCMSQKVECISLDGIISKNALLTRIKDHLGVDWKWKNLDTVSAVFSKSYIETAIPRIYVFTGSPKVASDYDYLGEWFEDLKVSSSEKVIYVGIQYDDVDYWSEYLGWKKPIFFK